MWTYADVPVQRKPQEYKFWRYALRRPDTSCFWQITFLDSNGLFATISDAGDWIYQWTYHGYDDFRKFLYFGISKDYFCGKVARKTRQNPKLTAENVKEHILSYRRDDSYSKEFAREEWERATLYLEENEYGCHCDWYSATHISDAAEMICMDYDRDPGHWYEQCYPTLRKALGDAKSQSTISK